MRTTGKKLKKAKNQNKYYITTMNILIETMVHLLTAEVAEHAARRPKDIKMRKFTDRRITIKMRFDCKSPI